MVALSGGQPLCVSVGSWDFCFIRFFSFFKGWHALSSPPASPPPPRGVKLYTQMLMSDAKGALMPDLTLTWSSTSQKKTLRQFCELQVQYAAS